MLSKHLKASFLLFVLTLWIHKVTSQSITNPVFWQAPREFNSTSAMEDDKSKWQYAISQDFQSIYVGNDVPIQIRRLVVDYSYSCHSTNTTMEALERLNSNNLNWSIVPTAPSIALIQRGQCNWSEKLEVARNISTTNHLNLTAILIYNNETLSQAEYHLYTRESLQRSFVYTDPLPADRNVTFMTDNDLTGRTDLPMPIYFAPASYGDQFIQFLGNNTNNNSQTKVLWQLTPVLIPLTSSTGTGGTNDDRGDGSPFSRGYLSYVIALAAIFLVALFAGVIFLRWWRVRQMREQREYEAQLSQHAYNIQMRMQAKPLPVDIVNSIPISKYNAQTVKNANCAICLEDYEEDKTEVRILGCGHGFCVLCIDPWLTQKSTMCPICKWDCLPPELQNEQDPEATITGNGVTTAGQSSTSAPPAPAPSSSSTTTATTTTAAVATVTATTIATVATETTTHDAPPTTETTSTDIKEQGSSSLDAPTTSEQKEPVLASSTNDNATTKKSDTDRQNNGDHVITINNADESETATTSNEESSSQVKNPPETQQH